MCCFENRPSGRRASSVMEGGQVVSKRESMGCRFKGELKALVERIHSTEVHCVLVNNRDVVTIDGFAQCNVLCP